jgi:hypothetical protein
MKSGFDYKEYEKWAKKLGIIKEQFNLWLKMFLLEQAQRCIAECKRRQRAVGAIDTGAMINSWYIGGQEIALKYTNVNGKDRFDIDKANSQIADITMIGDNLQVEIGNPMDYASFIEYGQRSYQGKYILTISINIIQQALPQRFEKAWQTFLKNGGII